MSANRKPLTISKPGLLLCEGEDEVNFFNAWFSELNITDVQVIAYQGKAKLTTFLADVVKLKGFGLVNRTGIIPMQTRTLQTPCKVLNMRQHMPRRSCKSSSPQFLFFPVTENLERWNRSGWPP